MLVAGRGRNIRMGKKHTLLRPTYVRTQHLDRLGMLSWWLFPRRYSPVYLQGRDRSAIPMVSSRLLSQRIADRRNRWVRSRTEHRIPKIGDLGPRSLRDRWGKNR